MNRFRAILRLPLLLALLIALLAGCGGDSGDNSAPAQAVTLTPGGESSGSPGVALLKLEDARSVAYSPDGTRVAISSGKTIWLYTADLVPIRALTGHTDAVRGLAWSPDGTKLASASLDTTARVWDADSGAALVTLTGHTNWVFAVAWSPDGARLATGSTDWTIRLWDSTSGQPLTVLGATLVEGFAIQLVDPAIPREIIDLETSERAVNQLAGATEGADARKLKDAQATLDRINARGDAALLAVLRKLRQSRYVLSVQINDAALADELSGLDEAAIMARLRALTPDEFAARVADGSLALSTDLDAGDIAELLKYLDGKTLALSVTRQDIDHENSVTALSWFGDTLASASADATVRLWDASTGALLATLDHADSVLDVAWSPDGTMLASAGWDNIVTLWDASSESDAFDELRTLNGHTLRITALVWSPDGTLIATGSRDATIRLWDAASGEELAELNAVAEVRALAWSPDGTRLISSAMDDAVRVWDVAAFLASGD
jgi:WD40 repeat protein